MCLSHSYSIYTYFSNPPFLSVCLILVKNFNIKMKCKFSKKLTNLWVKFCTKPYHKLYSWLQLISTLLRDNFQACDKWQIIEWIKYKLQMITITKLFSSCLKLFSYYSHLSKPNIRSELFTNILIIIE